MRKAAFILVLISVLAIAVFTLRHGYLSHAQSPQSVEFKTEIVSGHEAAAGRVIAFGAVECPAGPDRRAPL